MTRKQEFYRDMLAWALPSARNAFKLLESKNEFILLSPEMHRFLRCQYEVAQLVHGLAHLILQEEFSDQDVWFLNLGARTFIERCSPNCTSYPLFADFIQQLFDEVPEEKKALLEWSGPDEDYSWARPQPGNEIEW